MNTVNNFIYKDSKQVTGWLIGLIDNATVAVDKLDRLDNFFKQYGPFQDTTPVDAYEASRQELDKTNTQLATLDGQASSNAQSISSITDAIDDLNQHSQALEKNRIWDGGGTFKARILELEQQFGPLGFAVDDSTASVTSLVEALDELRRLMRDGIGAEFFTNKLNLLQIQAQQLAGLARQTGRSLNIPNYTVRGQGVDDPFRERPGLGTGFKNTVNPLFIDNYGSDISQQLVKAQNGTISSGDLSVLIAKLDTRPELRDMVAVLKNLQSIYIKIDGNKTLTERTQRVEFNSNVANSRSLQDSLFQTESLSRSATGDIADAQRELANDPVALRAKLIELNTAYDAKFATIVAGLDEMEKEIVKFGEKTPAEARSAVQSLNIEDKIAQTQSKFASLIEGQDEPVKELIKKARALTAKTVKQQIKALEQEVDTLGIQSKLVDTPEGVKTITETVRSKYADILALELKAFDAVNPEDPAGRQDLVDRVNADMQQVLARLFDTYLQELEEKIQEPVKLAKLRADSAPAGVIKDVLSRRADKAELAGAEQLVVALQQERIEKQEKLNDALVVYGKSSTFVTRANESLEIVDKRLIDAQEKLAAMDGKAAEGQVTLADAIQETNRKFAEQAGYVFDKNGSIDQAASNINILQKAYEDLQSGVSGAFENLFTNLTSGTKSVSSSFKAMGIEMLQVLQSVLIKALATQLVLKLFGNGEEGETGTAGILTTVFSAAAKFLAPAPGSALGGEVRGGIPGRDSVTRRLMPKEYVLRASAAQAVGRDTLDRLNNLGSASQSENIPSLAESAAKRVPDIVNVYAVSPDQVPPPGPRDIVAAIADNINRRGTIKQLIQAVQIGAV